MRRQRCRRPTARRREKGSAAHRALGRRAVAHSFCIYFSSVSYIPTSCLPLLLSDGHGAHLQLIISSPKSAFGHSGKEERENEDCNCNWAPYDGCEFSTLCFAQSAGNTPRSAVGRAGSSKQRQRANFLLFPSTDVETRNGSTFAVKAGIY